MRTLPAQADAPVAQLCWCPISLASDAQHSGAAAARLAAVDADGLLCVWSVHRPAPLARAELLPGGKLQAQGRVVDMVWGTATPDTLVVLAEPATLLFVSATSGGVVRTYALAHGAVMTGLSVNPWDRASFVLSSAAGSLVLAFIEAADSRILGRPVVLPTQGALRVRCVCTCWICACACGHSMRRCARRRRRGILRAVPHPGRAVPGEQLPACAPACAQRLSNGCSAIRQQHAAGAGSGHVEAHWVPNRGFLLLVFADSFMVYDADLGTVLERVPVPARCKPFERCLHVRGDTHCLGAAAQGGLRTLVMQHEVRPGTLRETPPQSST